MIASALEEPLVAARQRGARPRLAVAFALFFTLCSEAVASSRVGTDRLGRPSLTRDPDCDRHGSIRPDRHPARARRARAGSGCALDRIG